MTRKPDLSIADEMVRAVRVGGSCYPNNPTVGLRPSDGTRLLRTLAVEGEWTDGLASTDYLGWTSVARFDLFAIRGLVVGEVVACRRTNGSGVQWYAFYAARANRPCPLASSVLSATDSEAYLMVYTITQAIDEHRGQARRAAVSEVFQAHAAGRLHRRKIRGQDAYKVWQD